MAVADKQSIELYKQTITDAFPLARTAQSV